MRGSLGFSSQRMVVTPGVVGPFEEEEDGPKVGQWCLRRGWPRGWPYNPQRSSQGHAKLRKGVFAPQLLQTKDPSTPATSASPIDISHQIKHPVSH